ncbi:MAG: hypothetical protein J0L67_18855 [Cytophagales bacterium]|nr:hypothetical protein [Cytophagales bacterium]
MALYKILLTIIASTTILTIGYDIYEWRKAPPYDEGVAIDEWIPSPAVTIWLITVGVCLFLLATCYHVNIFDYSSPIEHKNVSFVTLKDFKGVKLPNRTLEGSKEFAYIVTTLFINRKPDEIVVKSHFHPSRSYVFNRLTADRLLLDHELYHFHITEFCARKMRKDLRELTSVPSDAEVSFVLDKTQREISSLQSQYDYDTHHGYILKQQKFWKNKVDSLLFLYKEYEDTSIRF